MSEAEPAPARMILHEFAAFLRRPALLRPTGLRASGALARLAAMTALQIAVLLLLLLPLIKFWQERYALGSPDAFGQVPPAMMLPVVVLIAPTIEEMLFRGWLTGRARALWLLACAIGCGVLLYATTRGLNPLPAASAILALALAAIAGWLALRRRGAPGWFAAGFPLFFYLSAAAFALAHTVNYSHFSALALPMVLPQLWAALVLGFVRMRIGLPAAIIAHAVSNAAMLATATLAG